MHSNPGIFSLPEVDSVRGLKTLMCEQRFSNSGGNLGVHPLHHPGRSPRCAEGVVSGHGPQLHSRLVQSPARTNLCEGERLLQAGEGAGGSSPPGRAARYIRCPTGGVGGEQLVAPKAPGRDATAAGEGREAGQG